MPTTQRSNRNRLLAILAAALFAAPVASGLALTNAGDVTVTSTCGKTETYTAVWEVQGNGHTSPMDGERVSNVRGIVTADFQVGTGGPYEPWGFFLQAHEPDCDDATSDGVFVYTGSTAQNVQVGDLVEVDGADVTEYQGPSSFTWDRTLTEVVCRSGCTVTTLEAGHGLPAPEEYDPPTDDVLAVDYNEAREGVLVHVTVDGTVVAAANDYNEFIMVRGTGADRLHRDAPPHGHGIMVDGDGVAAANCGQDGWGAIKTFDIARHDPAGGSVVYGPLNYNFNMYKVQQDDDAYCVTAETGDDASYDPADNPTPAVDADTLTVASLNAWNYFDTHDDAQKSDEVPSQSEYDRKTRKLADTVCNAHGLDQAHVIALEEIENDVVLTRLANEVATQCGVTYDTVTLAGPDDRSIQVGYLVRTDRVTIVSIADRQGCSSTNWGVDYEGNDAPPNVSCGGSTPNYLHSRPPIELVIEFSAGGATRTAHLFANHFKSKLTSSVCALPECEDWRLEEARHLKALANERLAADSDALVLVLGDLNDFYESAVLDELDETAGPLVNTWKDLPGPPSSGQGTIERYSYVYNGVSQTLDHVLVSPALDALSRTVSPRHANADWPATHLSDDTMYRASDHDPLLVAFQWASSGNNPPTASFTYSCTGPSCSFDGTGSTDSDGSISSYSWDFGDGNTATGSSVSHAFGASGDYTVTLTVTDDASATDTDSQVVSVSDGTTTTRAVVINEVEQNPSGTDDGNEWVELYNNGTSSIDLTGWSLVANGGSAVTVGLSGTLEAGAFKVVFHSSQFLDNADEWVSLLDDAGTLVDETPTLGDGDNDDRSWQRATDAGTPWEYRAHTRGAPNDGGSGGGGITLTATGFKVKGVQHADLAWDGATSTNVDVYRDGVLVTTTVNDGAFTDNIGRKGGGAYTYQVCEAGTTTCSNEATVTF